jgi:hypothetical protein
MKWTVMGTGAEGGAASPSAGVSGKVILEAGVAHPEMKRRSESHSSVRGLINTTGRPDLLKIDFAPGGIQNVTLIFILPWRVEGKRHHFQIDLHRI